MRIKAVAVLCTLALAGAWAYAAHIKADAAEDQIRQQIVKHAGPSASVDKISASEVPGIYNARVNGSLVHFDKTGRFMFTGDLIDIRSGENLSQTWREKNDLVKWAELPLDKAITVTKGNGERELVVFADPNCGYCKRLEKELRQLNNVTVHTFVFPFLSQDSVEKARNILCSEKPGLAWHQWMLNGKVPAAAPSCHANLDELVGLGKQLGVRGTPAIIFRDGSRLRGYAGAAEIERRLNAAK